VIDADPEHLVYDEDLDVSAMTAQFDITYFFQNGMLK